MIQIPEMSTKEYEGKSKDVWRLNDDTVILDFNKNFQTVDPVTGLPDPGANVNSKEEVPGLGRVNLALTHVMFKYFESKGIKTQLINTDIENGLMHVEPLVMIGKDIIIPKLETIQPIDKSKGIKLPYWHTLENVYSDGVEVVARRALTGSFLRRFPHAVYDMLRIDPNYLALVEFMIKNDDLGDPIITIDQLIENGIMPDWDVEEVVLITEEIEKIVQEVAKERGLELIDFKVEYGINNGEIILADEFATGSWRMIHFGSGNKVDKFVVASKFLGSDVVNDIRKNNLTDINDRVLSLTLKP